MQQPDAQKCRHILLGWLPVSFETQRPSLVTALLSSTPLDKQRQPARLLLGAATACVRQPVQNAKWLDGAKAVSYCTSLHALNLPCIQPHHGGATPN